MSAPFTHWSRNHRETPMRLPHVKGGPRVNASSLR